MNKITRRAILNTIWITPMITCVVLPVHAQCSSEETGREDCIVPVVPVVSTQNLVCTDSETDKNIAVFELVSFEAEELIVVGLTPEIDEATASHVSPQLPFIIPPEGTIEVTVQSETNDEFNCDAGTYNLAYVFDSKSGLFKGVAGGILLTPNNKKG